MWIDTEEEQMINKINKDEKISKYLINKEIRKKFILKTNL